MTGIEKIQGQNILRLFRELRKDSTTLKFNLPHRDDKYITRITDIQTRHNIIYFSIDCPERFQENIKSSSSGPLEFEFTGNDEVKYAFRTAAWRVVKNKLWLELPRWVERDQRRMQFRIAAPAGTILHFKLNSTHYELKVIDISLGGSLGVLAGASNKNNKNADLSRIENIEALELNFPSENKEVRVTIKRAEVKRVKRNPLTNRIEYALEFQEIDDINKRKLTEQIYRFQREFLRKRLRVNA